MRKRTKVIFVAAAVLLLCTVGGVLAKYIKELGTNNGVVRAYNFYFTSNLLDGRTHTLAPGSTEVTFTVGNHADDLRYSEVDIAYEIKVLNLDGTSVTGVTIATVTSKTLKNDKVNDAEVTVSGLQAGKTYTVTAVGTGRSEGQTDGGYTKTLTATIVVPEKAAKLFYHIDAYPDYILLTVWNEGEVKGSVSVTYTGIPDNTNPNMGEWKAASETSHATKDIEIKQHESLVFRFFGGKVTVSGATEKQP